MPSGRFSRAAHKPAAPRRLAVSEISPSRPRIRGVISVSKPVIDFFYEQISQDGIERDPLAANRLPPGVYLDRIARRHRHDDPVSNRAVVSIVHHPGTRSPG